MKKNLLLFVLLLTMVSFVHAQVIADFEVIKMNVMQGGEADQSNITVVPNPDPTGINTSNWVGKLLRDKDGVAWCGFWCPLPEPVDVTVNKYVHVKVWKPRISPIKFKLEGGSAGTLEVTSMNPQTLTGQWEDMVFDFSSKTGTYPTIVFMPDFEDPLTLTEDIVIYFDDIVVNNDPTPNTEPAYVMENFEELIKLNVMINDPATDLSSMVVAPNPDPSGINTSNYVVDFLRDKDGVPWGGFWSALPAPIDVTTNKYIHVKVWKPIISPLKFKIEKPGDNHEIYPMNEQTLTEGWEDIVFDFSAYTGEWTVIAFMPDFEDPVTLTDDIHIYFDDILLNNDPNPIIPTSEVILNVDMHGSGLQAGEQVYFAGNFGGIYGTWNEPGSNANNEMVDLDGDSVYTATIIVPPSDYQFKFFIGAGWNGGEWTGDPNRKVTIENDVELTYKWGVKPAVVTFNVDVKGSGLAGESIYIAGNFGGIYGTWNEPGTNLNNLLTAVEPLTDSLYTITMTLDSIGTYQLKFFKGEGWNGGEWTGDPNRVYKVRQDTTFSLKWGKVFPEGISEVSLAGKIQTYPNPVKDVLNINASIDLTKVIITNTVGQEVYRSANMIAGRKAIDLNALSNGLYFITFYAESGAPYTMKFLKY